MTENTNLEDTDALTVMEPGQSLAIGIARAEIDQQITTARAFPRALTQVADRVFSLATLDKESAEESMYALPRGGKPITGPSIRFAEIVKQAYGNCRAAARVVHVDRVEKFVEAEGIFHDLETNVATTARVRRRIVDSKGRLYSDDMIIVTGNAACSIALRNAIMGGVPKPLWRRAYEAVQATIKGDITTLSENRTKAIAAFAVYGVTPAQIFAALDVAGEPDITVEHIPVLRGMFGTLKNGEATVEEMFSSPTAAASAPQALHAGFTDKAKPARKAKAEPEKVERRVADDIEHNPDTGEVVEPAADLDTVLDGDNIPQTQGADSPAPTAEADKPSSASVTDAPSDSQEATSGPIASDEPSQSGEPKPLEGEIINDTADWIFKDSIDNAAPAGVTYLLFGDDVGEDGKLPTYQNGELFSRVGRKGAADLIVYDGHPIAQEAAPEAEVEADGPEPFDNPPPGPFADFWAVVENTDAWSGIPSALGVLFKTEDWKSLTEDEQNAFRAKTWKRLAERNVTVDPESTPTAFGMWMCAQVGQQGAAYIEGGLKVLRTQATYGKMPPEVAAGFETRATNIINKLRGS